MPPTIIDRTLYNESDESLCLSMPAPVVWGLWGTLVQLPADQSECYAVMLRPLRAGKECYDYGETA